MVEQRWIKCDGALLLANTKPVIFIRPNETRTKFCVMLEDALIDERSTLQAARERAIQHADDLAEFEPDAEVAA